MLSVKSLGFFCVVKALVCRALRLFQFDDKLTLSPRKLMATNRAMFNDLLENKTRLALPDAPLSLDLFFFWSVKPLVAP